jgi:hypothetical protein
VADSFCDERWLVAKIVCNEEIQAVTGLASGETIQGVASRQYLTSHLTCASHKGWFVA